MKQFKSLTTIDTFSRLGALDVPRQTTVPEVMGSISTSDNDICFLCCFVVVAFYCYGPENIFVILFAMLIYLVYLKYCDRL